MDYRIRNCTPQDVDTLLELCEAHAIYEQADYSHYGKKEKLHAALFATYPKVFCLIVEIDHIAVGYASYTFDFSTWDAATFMYLDCLYLTEKCRGHGIGEAIMKNLKLVARQNNCINIQWQTPTFNTRAIKFYRRIGGISKQKERFTLAIQ